MTTDQNPIVFTNTSPNSHLDVGLHNRKVSIVESPHAHENPAFESPARSRKVSANSQHSEFGPVRKKSILHNSHIADNLNLSAQSESGKHPNGDARSKKNSITDSIQSKTRFSDIGNDEAQKSWWYSFCVKCRERETVPSWQPPIWERICPYPFCPTYRQFSRMIAIALIGTLAWCIFYAIVGKTAGPGGRLFQLILLAICAFFGGWLTRVTTTLPALIGMLFVGVLFQNVGFVDIDESFSHISKDLRNLALVIILIRAGLDLDPRALKRLKFTVIRLGLLPWIIEASSCAVLSYFFLDLRWDYAFLLGAIIAAVSPAVVVPCLFRLRSKGYGVAKGIPTLIIAVASICDAASVAIFGIIKNIMFSDESLPLQIMQGPMSIIGGIGFGVLWGIICNYTPERHDPFLVPLRILLLLTGGLVSIFVSEMVGYGGAGPLGCVAAAFTCIVVWTRQGWDIEDNPAATAFEIFWMIVEPILFSVTGAQVKLNELDKSVVSIAVGILIASVLIRIIATVILGVGCSLNLKEKIFVSLSWMSKATVQAALGPVALSVIDKDNPQEVDWAKKILMVCVLSIILTAPTGAILISLSGPRLLTKTKFPIVPEGWRRSHRPSIRDISIIDEEEERTDIPEEGTPTTISQKETPKTRE